MSTSGDYNFNMTRDQIIRQALLRVGGISDTESPSSEQYQTCSDMLNMLMLGLRGSQGLIWEMEYFTIPLSPSSVVSVAGTTYECQRNHTSSTENEPGVGAEWQTFWFTPPNSTATPVSWVVDTDYTSICNVFLPDNIVGLSDLKYRQSNNTTIYMQTLSRQDYQRLAQTNTPSEPTQYFYYKKQSQSSIFFYPYPQSTQYTIEGYYWLYNQDMNTGGQTPNFLREWLLALVAKLAYEIAPMYGIFGGQLSDMRIMAEEAIQDAKDIDHEIGSTQIQPQLGPKGNPKQWP